MFLNYLTLFVALSLSVVAAWYSIIGLTAIFAAAVIPIIIMGGILEVAKIVTTVWLHENWQRCRFLMKLYLVPAVITLMIITSMGIFGFLSKAHLDQTAPTGDIAANIAIIDNKIQYQREIITANQALIKQLDDVVNQTLARTEDARGAERALQIRRSQARDRTRLVNEIDAAQKEISRLNSERMPLASELRKVELEVGPVKYIAALIYGDNPNANLLERAVRWVIIILVVVFDPLAIMMVLAATESFKWRRNDIELKGTPTIVPFVQVPNPDENTVVEPEKVLNPSNEFDINQHAYLKNSWAYIKPTAIFPGNQEIKIAEPSAESAKVIPDDDLILVEQDSEEYNEITPELKAAKTKWKKLHPGETLKSQRLKFERGEIDQLPWLEFLNDPDLLNFGHKSYGSYFPPKPRRGDQFVKTDRIPHILYKFNGKSWIEVDKNVSNSYTFELEYLDYLIDQLSRGEYDPELLTDAEKEQISLRINQTNK
jgi:hypothetical protein